MRVTHHLKLEEDKEVRRYAEGEREQEQDERMAQQEQPLGHERPVDHLVHVPWGLQKEKRRGGERQYRYMNVLEESVAGYVFIERLR